MVFSPNRILSTVLIAFGLSAGSAFAQTAVLDNFSTLRQNHSNSWNLWTSDQGKNQCGYQGTLSVANGKATTAITACPVQLDSTHCDLTSGNNACLYTEFNPDLVSGYLFDQGYTRSYVTSGTWNPLFNKLQFTLSCTADWPASEGQFGTYIKDPNHNTGPWDQGAHYYNQMFLNAYANRNITVQIGWAPTHQVGYSTINWPKDPEFVLPAVGHDPLHYWDYMSHFYINPWYGTGATTNRSCSYSNMQFLTTASYNEPEEATKDISLTYTGSQYELNWYGVKGEDNAWDIRYSTAASLRTLGFSNGSGGGTVSGPLSGSFYYKWLSPAVEQGMNMWVGIRPKPHVMGATNTSPILISTKVDTGLATGDQINIVGVAGNTAANNTWTVTAIPRRFWRGSTGTLTGFRRESCK